MILFLLGLALIFGGSAILWIVRFDEGLRLYGKMLVIFGCVFCVLPFTWGCASTATGKALNVAVIGSGVADLATTHQALSSGRGVEGNPWMRGSDLRRAVLKSSMVFAVIAGSQALEKSHPRLAMWTRVIAIGTWSYAAIQNYGAFARGGR